MAEAAKKDDKKDQAIFVKKIIKKGGHHGGAWKVAYADFVTAMMAFFLLLWLLNVTTEEQKNAISNYFDPTHPKVSQAESGAGGVLGGLSMAPQGSMATTVQNVTAAPPAQSVNKRTAQKNPDKDKKPEAQVSKSAMEKAKQILRKEEEKKFEEAKKQIQQALEQSPELKELAKNLLVDMTPEGLRIQIVDSEGKPMFASGSAQMYDYTKKLVGTVAEVIKKLPNETSIRGHTDSVPYGPGATYTNWELSTDRANSARRELLADGLPAPRINNVVGKADSDHLVPDKPNDARNRRISIILLKEELTNPDFDSKAAEKAAASGTPAEEDTPPEIPSVPVGTFKKTKGNVEFP
ncbi:MAG: flagellar motor protein MotB [Alphaproteobacteria bacterium]|nr:flagellar motor protein MotB [Alphaproteobacteria bacterium]